MRPAHSSEPANLCPSREHLATFAENLLPPDASQAVIEHLATCPACQASLHTLDDETAPFLATLRHPAPADPHSEEAGCRLAEDWTRARLGDPTLTPLPSPQRLAAPGNRPAGESPIPRRLGQYQILEKLGQGGDGQRVQGAAHPPEARRGAESAGSPQAE